MTVIKAETVKALRERTGLGMMECKNALIESQGDMTSAEQLLRIKSGAKASKMSARSATEGFVGISLTDDRKLAGMVELNCETDFVAKNEALMAFGENLAAEVARANPADLTELSALLINGESAEKIRQDLIMKLGENITIRRFIRLPAKGTVAYYRHGQKIGVMVDIEGGYETLGKDLAMHIAASKPICVSESEVPDEVLKQEKAVYHARALESGKPEAIIEKIITGNLKKFLTEVTLLGQPFVKNLDQTVGQLLTQSNATVYAFKMFIVGEGLEKKATDFASEVAATVAAAGQ